MAFLSSDVVTETSPEAFIRRLRAALFGLVAAVSAAPDLGTLQGWILLGGSVGLTAVALIPRKTKNWATGKAISDFVIAAVTIFLVLSGPAVWMGLSSFYAFSLAAIGGAILDIYEAKTMP